MRKSDFWCQLFAMVSVIRSQQSNRYLWNGQPRKSPTKVGLLNCTVFRYILISYYLCKVQYMYVLLPSDFIQQPYTKVTIPMTMRKLQELQKKWPRKVNNLTYSPHGISVLFRLNWFHGSLKDEYIHCFMTFPWLLLFKPVRSWVQTTFSNWKLFSCWRSPLNC